MLYKYYPPTRYTYEALLEGYFFFNKVSRQNDPYDASFKLLQADFLLKDLTRKGLSCDTETIMQNYATCSFSKQKDNKHMWALYANNYSGLVVGFDEEQFSYYSSEFLTRIPLLHVNYVESPITDADFEGAFKLIRPLEGDVIYNFSQCLGNDEKAKDALFHYICTLKEKKNWEAEEEVRLIAALDVLNNRIRLEKKGIQYLSTGYKIPIPPNCVKEIIIGHSFDNAYYPIIKEIANKYSIKNMEQTKCGIPFDLEFETIKYDSKNENI